MYVEVRYSSKSFRRKADVTIFNGEGKELKSVSRGDGAVDDEGFIVGEFSGLLNKAQEETLIRMAEVPNDVVVEIMDDGYLDARIADHKHRPPLTEEQKKIAIKRAEQDMEDCDFDDLLEAAVCGSIDTPKKLREWYKLAMEEQEEEDEANGSKKEK